MMGTQGKRIFKPPRRTSGVRDPKLIVIATEDSKAEPKYFEDLKEYYYNSRVHVEVLRREQTSSSPEHIIRMLDDFKGRFSLKYNDELWMVIDVDRWGEAKLSHIARLCLQKKYLLAVSNPSSDLWFLLHKKSLSDYPQGRLMEFRENKKKNGRTCLERELINVFGKFKKNNLDTGLFIPHVGEAISRARQLDVNPDGRWPEDLGTRIYRLAENIIKK